MFEDLRTELKRINDNNFKLTDIKIFERSLISISYNLTKIIVENICNDICNNEQTSKNKMNIKEENYSTLDEDRQTKSIVSFKVSHYIDTESLEKWIKNKLDNKDGFDIEYAMRKFTKFDETNEEFIKFKKTLNSQGVLMKREFIKNLSYIFGVKAISQTKNKFNEEYYNDETKLVQWENKNITVLLDNKNKRDDFLEKYWNKSWPIDEILIELLLRGNQTLEISYQELEVDITDKGLEYLSNSWWIRNWKWLATTIIAIAAIIISIIAL